MADGATEEATEATEEATEATEEATEEETAVEKLFKELEAQKAIGNFYFRLYHASSSLLRFVGLN